MSIIDEITEKRVARELEGQVTTYVYIGIDKLKQLHREVARLYPISPLEGPQRERKLTVDGLEVVEVVKPDFLELG